MLATFSHPHTYMSSAHNAFLPTIPSPLSPRSANVGPKPFRFSMSNLDQENTSTNASKTVKSESVAFSKRPVKKAPSPSSDELKERRRRNFLRRVVDEREEKRFEARGEDMQRLEFYRLQRVWEAQQAEAAPTLPWDAAPEEEVEEDAELPDSSWAGSAMQVSQQSQPEDEVDEVLAREDEELAALLEFMSDDDQMQGPQDQRDGDGASEHLWSDDEDYDALFSELMAQEQAEQQPAMTAEDGDAMDIS